MQKLSENHTEESWNAIGEVLDREMLTVDDVREELFKNDRGEAYQTISNCMFIFQKDPLLKGAIRKNELTGKVDIVKNLGWDKNSAGLTDTDVNQIHWYLEKNYGTKNERNINKAMNIIASENRYHPIRTYLEALEWDGKPRADNLLTKYLGVDNNTYTKEITNLLMQAAIHRIYEP